MVKTNNAHAPDKLIYRWFPALFSHTAALQGTTETEAMRKGQGLLSKEQFAEALRVGEIEILGLPNECYALITWGFSDHGKMMTILTVCAKMEHCAEALAALESAAVDREAKVIISIGHAGWRRLVQAQGFETWPLLGMKKVLP
jgi:hypothetical protein